MADPVVPAKRPNRVLAMVLLVIQVLGTLIFFVSSFWGFFHADRATGLWHLSYGIMWFLFFGWWARAAVRPFPAQG